MAEMIMPRREHQKKLTKKLTVGMDDSIFIILSISSEVRKLE